MAEIAKERPTEEMKEMKVISPPTPTLLTLPTEILFAISKLSHPVTSVCLGLTCKTLYHVHWDAHGKVTLENSWYHDIFMHLHDLIGVWMGEKYKLGFDAMDRSRFILKDVKEVDVEGGGIEETVVDREAAIDEIGVDRFDSKDDGVKDIVSKEVTSYGKQELCG